MAMVGRMDCAGTTMEAGTWLAGGWEARDSGSSEPSGMQGYT